MNSLDNLFHSSVFSNQIVEVAVMRQALPLVFNMFCSISELGVYSWLAGFCTEHEVIQNIAAQAINLLTFIVFKLIYISPIYSLQPSCQKHYLFYNRLIFENNIDKIANLVIKLKHT
jgi:hypothetical protein